MAERPDHDDGQGQPIGGAAVSEGFWTHRWFLVLAVLLATVPLLWPAVPPLTDLAGHLGRYRVEIDGGATPELAAWYSFDWSLIGNLGVDLLIVPLAPLFGLELAVKLILLLTAAMATAGVLWVSREAHGRVQPTALIAIPFFFGFPFTFGFVNFLLSMALALLSLALWMMLGRRGRPRLRAALFVPLSMALWVVHVFGWGVLGLTVFASEFVRRQRAGKGLVAAVVEAGLACLPLAPPLLLMLAWRSGNVAGGTADFFNVKAKAMWIVTALRDRWMVWDLLCVAVAGLLVLWAMFSCRFNWSPRLLGCAIALSLVYVLMPGLVMGSGYADMRLAPFLFLFWLLAVRAADGAERFGRAVALGALIFFAARTAVQTASFYLYAQEWEGELAALDHVPQRARLVTFVGHFCKQPWMLPRTEHLPALALERRLAFANDQWQLAGAQLLRVHYPAAGSFASEPSHMVLDPSCTLHPDLRSIDAALAGFPRDAFDYVWLVDPPAYDPRAVQGLRPIWRSGNSALFAVERAPGAAPVPQPQ